jgi:DNA-binding CsgD family transcriptional regulator
MAAISASLWLWPLSGETYRSEDVTVWLIVVCSIGLLRTMTAGASLAASTLVLEPVGTILFLSGTGGPTSPFLPMALAGIWWAATAGRGRRSRVYRVRRNGYRLRLEGGHEVDVGTGRPTSLIYGISMAVAYAVLVVPPALRGDMPAEAVEDGVVLASVWLLSEAFVRMRWRLAETSRRTATEIDASTSASSFRTAEELGLSAADAHLLACLSLGLTNRQIGQVMRISDGRVRYRLTLLYRSLGVNNRLQAVDRARELRRVMPIATD